jgi:GR25 family glycosyltransferase involved in LPS biosynthesis
MLVVPEKIFYINLERSPERRKSFEAIEATRHVAIDGCSSDFSPAAYGFSVKPARGWQRYMRQPAPQACFISHFLLWEELKDSEYKWVLILEDDVDISSVESFMEISKTYDYPEDTELVWCNVPLHPEWNARKQGSYAYCCSKEAARKLYVRASRQALKLPTDKFLASMGRKRIKGYENLCITLGEHQANSTIK